jgi:hypothetical protein
VDDRPLDLRSLVDVDAPEVVRAALKTFRRRVLVRAGWVILALAVGTALLVSLVTARSLSERVLRSSTQAYPAGATWDVGSVRFVLIRVASLGDGRIGLELASAATPGSGVQVGGLSPIGIGGVQGETTGDSDWWFSLTPPADGRIAMRTRFDGPCDSAGPCGGSFTIDLRALGVPTSLWR